jgi:hypothetical protein
MTNRSHPQGVLCWVDTEQPGVEAATEFYGGIFGWTFEGAMPPGAPGRYVIAKPDGQDVGAIAGSRQVLCTFLRHLCGGFPLFVRPVRGACRGLCGGASGRSAAR